MSNRNNNFKLEMLVLSILYQNDCYGYEITKKISTGTLGYINIKEGVLYPILYKLLTEQYISSYEEQVGRKIRVYYHIEESGILRLSELIKEYHEQKRGIENLIQEQAGDLSEKYK